MILPTSSSSSSAAGSRPSFFSELRSIWGWDCTCILGAACLHYAAYEFVRAGSLTFFTAHFGADHLPFALPFVPVGAMLLIALYNRLLGLFGPGTTLLLTTLLCACTLAACALLIHFGFQTDVVVPFLFIFRESYSTFLPSQYWSFFSSRFDSEQASRFFGPMIGVTGIAAMLAGMLVRAEAQRYSTSALVWTAAMLLLLAAALAWSGYPSTSAHPIRIATAACGGARVKSPRFKPLAQRGTRAAGGAPRSAGRARDASSSPASSQSDGDAAGASNAAAASEDDRAALLSDRLPSPNRVASRRAARLCGGTGGTLATRSPTPDLERASAAADARSPSALAALVPAVARGAPQFGAPQFDNVDAPSLGSRGGLGTTSKRRRRRSRSQTHHLGILHGYRSLRLHPILPPLFVSTVTMQCTATVLSLAYNNYLALERPLHADRSSYTGLFYAASKGASALIQFFGIGPVLKRWPVGHVLFVQPVAIGAVVLLSLLVPCLETAALAMLCFKISEYAVYSSAKEMLFVPLGAEAKFVAKEYIDVVGYRLGKGGVSVLLSAVLSVATVSPYVYSCIGMLTLAVWMYAAVQLRRHSEAAAPPLRTELTTL
jgi:hypothetical protein